MVKGGKILASLEVTDNEKFVIAELTSNVTVRSDEQFAGNPVLSLGTYYIALLRRVSNTTNNRS